MSTKPQKSKSIKSEEEALFTFLRRTKEGKYTPVDMKSIAFPRITQEYGMIVYPDEEYYYSLS